mmetsp:Transcript_25160/g.54935  ORF Transcript_25160/g.54935 Transcript_25160/m.54935 type:complete len:691 (+) Transcript_25160:76-2148(+)
MTDVSSVNDGTKPETDRATVVGKAADDDDASRVAAPAVAAAAAAAVAVSSPRKRKRIVTACDTATTTATAAGRPSPLGLPHGTFTGDTIYRNKLNARETFALGHVSLNDLIPHRTSRCFATTFVDVHATWLERMFGDRVDGLLIVRNDKRDVKFGQRKVGDGELTAITIMEEEVVGRMYQRKTPAVVDLTVETTSGTGTRTCKNEGNCGTDNGSAIEVDARTGCGATRGSDSDDDDIEVLGVKRTMPNWHRMAARPASGGSLHSKILLFRTDQGLRVVVAGSNLCPQWTADRDCLWVQDFDVIDSKRQQQRQQQRQQPHRASSASRFESTLRSFVSDISGCREARDDQYVRRFTSMVLSGIDFSTAKAELVFSFPRSVEEGNKKPGGWPMLAKAVERTRNQYPSPDTDDEAEDDGSSDPSSGMNVVHATAGSFGDVTPTFLRQMYGVMNTGSAHAVPTDTTWNQVPDAIKCLWPSIKTAQSMLPSGVINSLRNIPMRYWRTIPPYARRRIFHDAAPNTPSTGFGINERDCHPVVHGKIIFATPRRVSSTFPTLIYVGSHNFSRAAWGEGTTRPRNVEMGVVLATADRDKRMEWIHRLPCALVPHTAVRPRGDPYIPASAHKGIKTEWEKGDPKRAEEMLVSWLARAELGDDEEVDGLVHDDVGGRKLPPPREVVKLCGEDEVVNLYEKSD